MVSWQIYGSSKFIESDSPENPGVEQVIDGVRSRQVGFVFMAEGAG